MQKETFRIAVAQLNCTVGDLEGNAHKISQYIDRAKGLATDIIVFPELAISGYPPEDLLLKPGFVKDNIMVLKGLARSVGDIIAIIGFIDMRGRNIYNAAAVIYNGNIHSVYHKIMLPNYGVFDEKRYFTPGGKPSVFKTSRTIFGVNICEDIWHEEGPTKQQVHLGARMIFNISSSPYHMGKIKEREEMIRKRARENRVFIVYANLVGGQDELVFDGRSMFVDNQGKVVARADAFKEDLLISDIDILVSDRRAGAGISKITGSSLHQKREELPKRENMALLDDIEEIYQALILGLRDYVSKNGFKKVVVGLSGGIDSSLVVALAADALGKENVTGVFMPSRYSSQESERDAIAVAENLGIKLMKISIEQIYKIYLLVLEPYFSGYERNAAEENLQARIRGNILMALSNKFTWMVLTTGNKSEMSTGYATLYGDMAGGFAVIKDVPKTYVYKLARYRNSLSFVIPEQVFTKEPTAELKPNQKDSDTLPPYEILDNILKAYVEEDSNLYKIIASGFDEGVVARTLDMVDKSEYKRRQSPPGIKITPKAFGRDRRMPITNKYRG